VLFSDAVFAIAITLLIIEIKIPEVNVAELKKELGDAFTQHPDKHLLHILEEHLLAKFIGFIVSFG